MTAAAPTSTTTEAPRKKRGISLTQAILLGIYRAFERERIQFAHPLSVIRVAEPTDPAGGWLPHALRTPADELSH